MKAMNLEEAAAYLRISKDSVRDMADSGKLPAAKIGPKQGRWVFSHEALEKYLADEISKQTATRRGNPVLDERFGPAPAQAPKQTRRKAATPPVIQRWLNS